MHRLFVAIQPPPETRDALAALAGGVLGARWQTEDQLHLTLRFIGEVDRHCAEDIAVVLATVHHPSIEVTLSGIDQFDRRGRIDTLWIGAAPAVVLGQLHGKIDQALIRAGLKPEGRAYLPHVTLARFGRESGAIGALIDRAPAALPPFAATDFCLYESHLGRTGATYDIIERYRLA